MFGPTSKTQARLYRLLSEYREAEGIDVLYAFGLEMYLDKTAKRELLQTSGVSTVSTGWEEGGSRYLEVYHDGTLSKTVLEFRLRGLGLRVLDVL